MSKSQQASRTTTIPEDEDLTPQPMSQRRRLFLIGVAIFCLIIFSVTGPMMTAFDKMFGGGPALIATAELPSGKVEFTNEDQVRAAQMMQWEERFFGPQFRGESEEDELVYTLLRRLGDDLGLVVSDATVQNFIIGMIGQGGDYQTLVRNMGFTSALQFEMLLRDVLRVPMLEEMLASSQVPTEVEVLDLFKERYEEFQLEYVIWRASEFEAAAQETEPTAEELQNFYDEGLSFTQRRDLENEEAVAFEAVVVTADALATEAVEAWAPAEEPTEEMLSSFYEFNRRFLYERPLPEDSSEQDPELGPYLSREELGGERIKQDWMLQAAAQALQGDAAESSDLTAFAAEKGVEAVQFGEPIPASQLAELERIGNERLSQLLRVDEGIFLASPILGDGYAVIARATMQVPRELPELEEIRESVIDYWREGRQPELATEAADTLIKAFPQPEIEGDAVVVDAENFASAAAGVGLQSSTLGWIARNRRAGEDPVWSADDDVSDWLRSQVNRELDDAVEGQVLGPYSNTFVDDRFVVVGRLVDTREPSIDRIW
ncbi:MAG: SurA N-terminal domain-containing protein, partial [Planctomycetes bacterium]|nr:SurA N-terminal domain-containing protein [Planctomycetota bacterium]